MTQVAAALAPVFALILIGYGFRRSGFLAPPFWEAADRLTYYVLFPALLIHNLATAPFAGLHAGGVAAALLAATLAVAAVVFLARRRFRLDGRGFSSLFQGAIRPNTYVGLASAAALFGAPGVTLAAVAIAATVPLVNLLSVGALAVFAGAQGAGGRRWPATLRTIFRSVARNPLVLACLAGLALNASGLGLPRIGPVVDALGRAALPLGLLSVGAGLDWAALGARKLPLLTAAGAKLVLLPAFAALVLAATGTGGTPALVGVLFASLPTSASSYIMARQMGGDHGLMAAIITAEIVLAAVTIPAAQTLAGLAFR
jgi:predicted permease